MMSIKINLLPWRVELQFKKIYYFKMQMAIFLVAAGSILLLWHVFLEQKINRTTKQANQLQKQLDLAAKQIQDGSKLKQQKDMGHQVANQTLSLEQKQIEFIQIFNAIHQGMLANLYITQLSIKDHEVKIMGQVKLLSDLNQFNTKLFQIKSGSMPIIQKISRQNDCYDFVLLWPYGGK
ncbi:MAG TPA: hypothetical protein DEG23_03215 [Coxiellaceae bacterium]|nr:hypothetical protein [Coxiellaceae bacterium]